MNITNDITRAARTILVAASIGAATLAVSSCGDQVQPPAQDISVELPEPAVKNYDPTCNTRAAATPCADPTFAPNRQKIDFAEAPNRQKIDSEFAPR